MTTKRQTPLPPTHDENEVLRRMLHTPPKPHKDKPKPAKKKPAADRPSTKEALGVTAAKKRSANMWKV